MTGKQILIVEDDKALADVLSYRLQSEGFELLTATDGDSGYQVARDQLPDLIVLDIMLPVLDGFSVCRRLRGDSRTRDILILMLSARSAESDQVEGFRAGADDYVTKPFSTRVLLERVKALLRRPEAIGQDNVIFDRGLVVDRARHRVMASDVLLDLTLTEFSLLDVLIRHPGRAFTRAELIDGALGQTMVGSRTIDVHILSLRRKLGPFAHLVETVRGVGYRFREPQQEDQVVRELANGSR